MLALTRYQPEAMISQARRALEYLHPDNLPFRGSYLDAGVCLPAPGGPCRGRSGLYRSHSYQPGVREYPSHYIGYNRPGQVQESENQLYQAAETYRCVLQLVGDQPQPIAIEAHLGLARIFYEWNDLDAAEQHGQQSLQLARQYDRVI